MLNENIRNSTCGLVFHASFFSFCGWHIFFNIKDKLTTVTERIAMASPANSGLKVNPKNGYNIPAATGISAAFYTKAQNRFCFILDITF